MPTPIRASEATLIEVRQALQRMELFRRLMMYEHPTDDPGLTDDVSKGFSAGTMWTNVASEVTWRLVDNTEGAAVWNRVIGVLGTGGGAAGTPQGIILATNSDGDYKEFGTVANGLLLAANSGETLGLSWEAAGEKHYTLYAGPGLVV